MNPTSSKGWFLAGPLKGGPAGGAGSSPALLADPSPYHSRVVRLPAVGLTRFAVFSSLACGAFGALSSCIFIDGTIVEVTLQEFSVMPAAGPAPAGRVTFHVVNEGDEDHEFLVIRTDLAANALPTENDGRYLENGPGTELLDEIALIRPGTSANLTLELGAGNYVLICNLVDIEADGALEAHYALGMFAAFAVE